MDYLTKVEVKDKDGKPAPFNRLRVETPLGPVVEVTSKAGKADAYILQYSLTRALKSVSLVLVDRAGVEHPANINPDTKSYTFVLDGADGQTPDHNDQPDGTPTPWQVLNAARKAVPAVNYALGIAGIAAAASIVGLFVGQTQAGVRVIGLVFIGMVLLFVFARLAVASDRSVRVAGAVLLWSVLLFFIIFLGFTVSAFATGAPRAWAEFLGIVRSTPQDAATSSTMRTPVGPAVVPSTQATPQDHPVAPLPQTAIPPLLSSKSDLQKDALRTRAATVFADARRLFLAGQNDRARADYNDARTL
jgi:hypothetical protein